MGELEEITIKQIQIEIVKTKKETEKITEEIADLRGQKPYNCGTLTWWRDFLGILTVAGSIVYGIYNFIGQLEDRNKFQITILRFAIMQ